MTSGTVISYDPDAKKGIIDPDDGDERIPFDEKSLRGYPAGEHPRAGDRVRFVVEGGMAGIWAKDIKPIS